MFLSIPIITLIFVTGVNITFALLVLSRNKKKDANIYYAVFAFGVSLWAATNALFQVTNSSAWAFFYANLSYVSGIIMAVSILFFSYVFPKSINKNSKEIKYFKTFVLIVGVFFTWIIFTTNLILLDVDIQTSARRLITNKGLYFFASYLFLVVMVIFYNLYKSYKFSTGIRKNQVKFFILGIVSLALSGLFFNLLLPIFGIYSLVWLGPNFAFFMVAILGYSIIKHRLLNIKFVLTRSFIYFVMIAAITTALIFVFLIVANKIEASHVNQYIVWAFIALVIVVVLEPFKKVLAHFTDRLFYREKIDYGLVLKKESALINSEIDLYDLIKNFSQSLKKNLKLEKVSLLISVDEEKVYLPLEYYKESSGQETFDTTQLSLYINSPLIQQLNKYQATIVADELDRQIYDMEDVHHQAKLQEVLKNMEELRAGVVVPIERRNKMTAILVIGRKVSGETFSTEDITLFEVLANQLAAALERSKLYQKVQDFNYKLQQEVDRQTAELKQKNDALEEANENLTQLDKAKSEFMSIASHQLRTPLAGIVGYLSMVKEGSFGTLNDELGTVIGNVSEASQRLVRLVNTLLNVTQIEAGHLAMHFQEYDVKKLVQKEVAELLPTAKAKGVELIFSSDRSSLNAIIDHDKFGDVVLNLVDNAIKYTNEGTVKVGVEQNGEKIHFTVQDTGIGIDPEDAKRLFDKFVRGSGIAQVHPNGSGLGLYIVKKIVEGHKGTVWAESEGKGKGTTFHVEIPLTQE